MTVSKKIIKTLRVSIPRFVAVDQAAQDLGGVLEPPTSVALGKLEVSGVTSAFFKSTRPGLVRVFEAPNAGQYSFNSGWYEFHPDDYEKVANITITI